MPGVGIPKAELVYPPIVKRNYGKWVSHDYPRAGVVRHVSITGEECYTVRVGMPTNARVSTQTLYKLCDLADKYTEGYFRVTTRNHVEFVGVKKEEIQKLIKELNEMGLPVGGTNNSFQQTVCCTGWLHCQIAATDSPSIAKAVSDALYEEFVDMRLPARLKVSVAGCMNQCGEGSTADVGIVGIYRRIPRINEEKVKGCERPNTIAVCPTSAIKPKGKDSMEINPERCVYCAYCVMTCEAMVMDYDSAGTAIVVGGKAGHSGAGPSWARVAVPFIPNDPPRWKKQVEAVKKIVAAWAKDAKKDERVADWIARIGWEKFFEKTGLPMSMKHVDGFSMGGSLERARSGVRFRW